MHSADGRRHGREKAGRKGGGNSLGKRIQALLDQKGEKIILHIV